VAGLELLIGKLDRQIYDRVQHIRALLSLCGLRLQQRDQLSIVLRISTVILMKQVQTRGLRIHQHELCLLLVLVNHLERGHDVVVTNWNFDHMLEGTGG
jgi:hypothetical protein